MRIQRFSVDLEIYDNLAELPGNTRELMERARKACKEAYAPYSLFKVGAAIRLSNDQIVTGNNQENAAFPSGLCAERVAAFRAATSFPNQAFSSLALAVHSEKKAIDKPTPPCGACRQVLAEYEHRQGSPIAIYFTGSTGAVVKARSVEDILPLIFDRSFVL